jgi:hypothetical protein
MEDQRAVDPALQKVSNLLSFLSTCTQEDTACSTVFTNNTFSPLANLSADPELGQKYAELLQADIENVSRAHTYPITLAWLSNPPVPQPPPSPLPALPNAHAHFFPPTALRC